jgi:hypothetical protein
MTPIDLAYIALLAVSFAVGVIVLAAVTLVLEALMFAIGLGRRDWQSRN